MARLSREAIDATTDQSSPDFMNFTQGYQPVVDTAFLSHAMIRAPKELLGKLDERCLKATRSRTGYDNLHYFSRLFR
ncbi:DUF2264 domain-containing protein [Paenibacillus sp. NPDC056579]|uniref:DUF2264 domain-containing protein n=1 Tax=Paenibacillus sp. NPDC056579 TaxID=3345871 RepID=UPI0036B0CCC4